MRTNTQLSKLHHIRITNFVLAMIDHAWPFRQPMEIRLSSKIENLEFHQYNNAFKTRSCFNITHT